MNFNAFTTRDIQTFIALTSLAESAGINDVIVLRQRLYEHLNERTMETKKNISKIKKNQRVTDESDIDTRRLCPSCKKGFLKKYFIDDVAIYSCAGSIIYKKCGYSEKI